MKTKIFIVKYEIDKCLKRDFNIKFLFLISNGLSSDELFFNKFKILAQSIGVNYYFVYQLETKFK